MVRARAAMAAKIWGFQSALGWGLYTGELGVQHTNSRTKSISYSRLDSLSSFRFLGRDKTGLVGFDFIPKRW
jgi:hypothetical protein